MKRNSLLRICVLMGFVIALAALPATASAQSHTGARAFSQDWASPEGEVQVRITAEGYGASGLVVETLPPGFTFMLVNLRDSQVEVERQEVRFILSGETEFIYQVRAPAAEGAYTFSGFVLNDNGDQAAITGDTSVRVGPPPTPAATATPEPTATPTPEPTPTPTPDPTATPTPAATSTPTIIVIVPETPTPEPTPTAAPTPSSQESESPGGLPGIIWFIPVVAAIGLILAVLSYLRTRS